MLCGGGGGDTEAHFPNPPTSLLGRRDGRGGLPLAPTSILTQNKGPDTEPHFSNPPPSFGGRPCHTPPPPPQSNFQVALCRTVPQSFLS